MQCRVILFLSLVSIFPACAESNFKANESSYEECKSKALYFECEVNNSTYSLCGSSVKNLFFWQSKGGAFKKIHSGTMNKEFIFEGYHRFKVTQNGLTFSANDVSYELFDYIDEESDPAVREYGVVMSGAGIEGSQNMYCEGKVTSRLSELGVNE